MGKVDDFGETQGVEITVLVDNRADLLVKSTDTVKRYTDEPLLAEHGFAALIHLKAAGIRILWDAGMTKVALLENMHRLEIDPTTIDKIALSHGHDDHYAAMRDVVSTVAGPPSSREWDKDVPMEVIRDWAESYHRIPLVAHPAAFRERWGIDKDGKKHGPHFVPSAEWEAAGAELVLSEGPHELGPGCWTTGEVPRLSFEKAGTPQSRHYRDGDQFFRDKLEDDQSIVINVQDKGLVILSGCAHAGIVNTLNYGIEISGVNRIYAILGGFHLAPAEDEEIQCTIDAIRELEPVMVVPSHCTGFKAISEFARQMPDEFVLGSVGTTYLF